MEWDLLGLELRTRDSRGRGMGTTVDAHLGQTKDLLKVRILEVQFKTGWVLSSEGSHTYADKMVMVRG